MRTVEGQETDRRESAVTRPTASTHPSGGSNPSSLALTSVLALQRSAGNAAVASALRARASHIPARPRQPAVQPLLPSPPAQAPQVEPEEESVDVDESEPLVESTMVGGAEAGGDAGPDTAGDEDLPPELTPEEQSQQIVADATASEQQIRAVAAQRRQQISTRFAGVRGRASGLLNSASAGVASFLGTQQAAMQNASSSVLGTADGLLGTTLGSARALVTQARTTLDGAAAAATAGLQAQVGAAAGRITGLVDNLSLPDLPGVSAIRSGARALVGRAAGLVSSGLDSVRRLIGAALGLGSRLLSTALSGVENLARSALTKIRGAVAQAIQLAFAGLRRIADSVLGSLRRALSAGLQPALGKAESTITGQLSSAEQRALTSVRTSRDQHVQAVREGRAAADGGDLVDQARQNNASVVSTFTERTDSILGSVFGALAEGSSALAGHVGRLLARVYDLIRAPVSELLSRLADLSRTIGQFFSALLRELGDQVTAVVGFVRSAVQDPVDAVVRFAGEAAGKIGTFLAGLPGRVLGGNLSLPTATEVVGDPRMSGPIIKPPPGPIVKPALELLLLIVMAVGALVLWVAPQLTVVAVAILALIGVEATTIAVLVVIGILALLALALLLLALYLLYRLLKPGPKKPPPTITHVTDVAAPDGSANSRILVGVGEKVTFTGSASGGWSANAGTPRRGTGLTFNWTAPNRRTSATIKLRVSGATAAVRLSVLEPNNIRAHKLSELSFPPGTTGAGMMLDFEFHPLAVSFSRAQTREVSGPASAITGYYKQFSKKSLAHNAGPVRFFPISVRNRFDGGVQDKASQSGAHPPFSNGSFHWVIPNKFKVAGESGDGKQYTKVIQEFTIDPTGKIRVDKAGEHVERSP